MHYFFREMTDVCAGGTNFKPPIYTVDAFSPFFVELISTRVTPLCHKRLLSFFFYVPAASPLVMACYESVSLLFERECVDLFYE